MGVTLSHHKGAPLLRLIRPGCYEHFCPGCRMAHRIEIGARTEEGRIGWDHDIERPTFEPRLTVLHGSNLCQYVLRAGVLHFADTCFHSLAGQVVPLPDFPTRPA